MHEWVGDGDLKLDVGCGRLLGPGWIGVDLEHSHGPWGKIDIGTQALPFENESMDYVRASHVLEHLSFRHVRFAIREIARVLKSGGTFFFEVPDFAWTIQRWLDLKEEDRWELPLEMIFGEQLGPGGFHKCGFTLERLVKLSKEAGLIITRTEEAWSQRHLGNVIRVWGTK